MRRHEKQIRSRSEMEEIINNSTVCRLAMTDGDRPYLIPLCFGYRDGSIFFHSAPQGRKIDILKNNPNVCFAFDIDQEVTAAERACGWSMRYRSVVGFGKARIVEEGDDKRKALEIIMENYSAGEHFFDDSEISTVLIIRVDIEEMTGKKSGYA
ncbi:MAG: pyridoxamine 5'-phosphate oxidase family protein [bacterium]